MSSQDYLIKTVPYYPGEIGSIATSFISIDSTTTSAWKLLDTVKINLVGTAKETDTPRKELTEWLTLNQANITKYGL